MFSVPALLPVKGRQGLWRTEMRYSQIGASNHIQVRFSCPAAKIIVLVGLQGLIETAECEKSRFPDNQISRGYKRDGTVLFSLIVAVPRFRKPGRMWGNSVKGADHRMG
jgi:hypothetical protein